MVRHSVSRWLVALLALVWAWPVAADAIAPAMPGPGVPTGTGTSPLFATGNVETDMPAPAAGQTNGITVIPGQAFNAVAQPQWMTSAGLIAAALPLCAAGTCRADPAATTAAAA